MIGFILILLVVLWLFGYVQVPFFRFFNFTLFYLNGRPISLYDVLAFFVILWLISILPYPLRQIVIVILILWLLSTLGVFIFGGFSGLLMLVLILGLLLYVLGIF